MEDKDNGPPQGEPTEREPHPLMVQALITEQDDSGAWVPGVVTIRLSDFVPDEQAALFSDQERKEWGDKLLKLTATWAAWRSLPRELRNAVGAKLPKEVPSGPVAMEEAVRKAMNETPGVGLIEMKAHHVDVKINPELNANVQGLLEAVSGLLKHVAPQQGPGKRKIAKLRPKGARKQRKGTERVEPPSNANDPFEGLRAEIERLPMLDGGQ